jgi:dihydropyrimidinase
MTLDLAIVDGTCVTADRTFEADVAIDDGSIVALGDAATFPAAETVVDASGQLVMPGFVDPHVHIDDASSIDTFATATGAAAVGGITTVVDFAWQTPDNDPANEPETLMDGIERKKAKAESTGAYVDYGLHGSITVEDRAVLDELADAVAAGVPTFKMFTAYDFGISNGFIRRALERIAELDAVGVFHTEDNDVVMDLVAEFKERGRSDSTWYPKSRPDDAEAMAAEDVLRLARRTGAKYYGVHTSCRATAEVFEDFIEDGSQIRTETCTHYTIHDDSVYAEQGNLPLIAPPIRKPDDVEAMFEHLRRGTFGIVTTDHAPHYSHEKEGDWWDSPYGAGSLQESVALFHDEAVNERGFSYPFLVATMSTNPAATFGLSEKGTLTPGTDADVVVFDPSETYTITAEDGVGNQDFTIYEGREVTGRVTKTFVRGELVAEDGALVADPDVGEFVEREVPDWSV